MSAFLATFGLFGALFGADDGRYDCAREAERASRTMAQIAEQWPMRPAHDALGRHVQELADTLAHVAPEASPPRVHVLRNLEPLAFSAGAGQILVSEGLLLFVHDRAQLAAVLAHELAHQLLGHFCLPSRHQAGHIAIGGVTQDFDLQRELAADQEATHLLAMAGFNPDAMAGVLACLIEAGPPDQALSTRLGALGATSGGWRRTYDSGAGEFARLRAQLASELDGLGAPRPCRAPR